MNRNLGRGMAAMALMIGASILSGGPKDAWAVPEWKDVTLGGDFQDVVHSSQWHTMEQYVHSQGYREADGGGAGATYSLGVENYGRAYHVNWLNATTGRSILIQFVHGANDAGDPFDYYGYTMLWEDGDGFHSTTFPWNAQSLDSGRTWFQYLQQWDSCALAALGASAVRCLLPGAASGGSLFAPCFSASATASVLGCTISVGVSALGGF
jgi:hypothetical protein